ncbi:TIGR04141 family sporadically distributed protein [Photobacterium leiognathi]|uniref:TIGR04141 family sporadically distributed protein n=1 Tax=Photobacterium leiognathi TaxID=553611 RepID=UPI000D1573B3|nr:TIGR04141 family sporadically distributed protein [Photobacterium leiognathi]PSW58430.1 hypothetical protein C0W50_02375 [Photobacterium leiognathi subsp. mandapamensis]
MSDEKPFVNLKAFLSKADVNYVHLEHFLSSSDVVGFELTGEIQGKLFVKRAEDKEPKWVSFINTGIEGILSLTNRSSSAVLLIKTDDRVIAYTFGYGRFMLDHSLFVQDFGIKTALNTLMPHSLRSVELFTVDRSAIQKKTQAVRDSSVDDFGIDVSKDILRAVTGAPNRDTDFLSVSGGDSVYSFSKLADFSDLPDISQSLIDYYNKDLYKANFSWVDNIRRLKNDTKRSKLENRLREQVESKDATNLAITAPEVISWDKVIGFSFTHSRNTIYPTLDINDYFNCLDSDRLTLSALKSHKLYVHQDNTSEVHYSLYKSFYFEVVDGNSTYILFSGDWFEVDNDYIGLLNQQLSFIGISSLNFPTVHIWSHDGKDKIESEGAYNERAALLRSYHLLDKKTIKSRTTTSPIELCDLLTDQKQFIHVKHKKGGSSGLSHLFAQGYVAAEVVLSDREFRKKARRKLQNIRHGLNNLIPLDRINSHEYEVVYLILGEDNSTVKSSLPFFSKINLVKAYENLTQKGFKVTICGVGKEEIEPPQEIKELPSENTELET